MSYTSAYPPEHSDTYVKATTKASTSWWPYYATDPTKSLTGSEVDNSWQSAAASNQRFHIDLGAAKVIKRIYYENYHESGAYTNAGANAFTLMGSNSADAFADLDINHDTGWTSITTSANQFDQHIGSDVADPKYITATNDTPYRYYCLRITNNWGYGGSLGLRRIELQTEDEFIPLESEQVSVSTVFEVMNALSVTDDIDIGDDPTPRVFGYPAISESIVTADESLPALSFTLTDVLFLWDVLMHGWAVTNEESLVLTDSTTEVLGLMVHDWLTLIDSQTNNWNGRETINQNLNLYDIAEQVQKFADTITEDLTIGDTATYVLTVVILEYLGFADLANIMRTSYPSVSESVVLSDSAVNAWQEIISDTLQAVDAASVAATFVNVVQEALSVADTASIMNRMGVSVNESLVLAETISSKGTFYNAVYDTIALNVSVELGNEVYECYVLNTPKFHPSMYSGFNFNSYCVFENRAFGANDTGIYELTGNTDAGNTIHTGTILSQTDFGLRNNKRFRKGYLGITGTSPVMVFECEDGSRKVYSIDTKGVVVASHEQKSKKWKLSVADFNALDVIKLIPVILSK
jgi:hypothetical protein